LTKDRKAGAILMGSCLVVVLFSYFSLSW